MEKNKPLLGIQEPMCFSVCWLLVSSASGTWHSSLLKAPSLLRLTLITPVPSGVRQVFFLLWSTHSSYFITTQVLQECILSLLNKSSMNNVHLHALEGDSILKLEWMNELCDHCQTEWLLRPFLSYTFELCSFNLVLLVIVW